MNAPGTDSRPRRVAGAPCRGIGFGVLVAAGGLQFGASAAFASAASAAPASSAAPAASAASHAADLPPRADWRATASAPTQAAMAPSFAIDGDATTRWGGPFSPGHWFQVDLGSTATVAGVHLHWDSAYTAGYTIATSSDGTRWRTVYETHDGTGQREYAWFPATHARFVRLASLPRTSDWGVNLYEFEPIAADAAPRIAGSAVGAERVWLPPASPGALPASGVAMLAPSTAATTRAAPRALDDRTPGDHALGDRAIGDRTLDVRFPRPLATAGLEVTWAAPRAGARLEARTANGEWKIVATDPSPLGRTSLLAAREALRVDALRLVVTPAKATDGASVATTAAIATPAIRRLRLLGPDRIATPMTRYRVAASREHAALFPSTLHDRQVYWTVVGVPAGHRKALLDEWGNVEARKGAPLVQPVWRDRSGGVAAAFDAQVDHTLRRGWMPMPAAAWSPRPGLRLSTEAFATFVDGVAPTVAGGATTVAAGEAPTAAGDATTASARAAVALVRHRLTNTGATRIAGRLNLVVRPIQVSPPWQNAGLAPIHSLSIEGGTAPRGDAPTATVPPRGDALAVTTVAAPHADAPGAAATLVRVNGEPLFLSLTPPAAGGAAAFGAHGETEVTRDVVAGRVPSARNATDGDGLAAGVLAYDVDLAPGAHADVVLAVPLDGGTAAGDLAPTLGSLVPAAFDTLAARVEADWQARLGGVGLSLPDRSIVDTVRAQAAYMLLNQTGHALQAGPRNYDRSFIRDGSATAASLLRLGMPSVAREYLRWFATHAVHENGLVSPILNGDGTVNRGFGSDIEYDSQGEFLWLVAEIARLDGGAATVREFEPQVRRALSFLEELRARTLVPGYLADQPAPERFRGLLAPSISHEGYATPTHSYWDDFWGLKGWHDGAWLAREWGDAALARHAGEQYAALRESMTASIAATMRWKGTDLVPAAADLGDVDPAGTSIGIDPAGQLALLPRDALERTFMRYFDDVRARERPGALYAYTPYEWRNVLTFVHLDRPREAAQLFDHFLTGRRPVGWRVFAEVVHSDPRRAIYLGDMPHTWIGSEFIRTVLGMLMREGDESLVLLPGTPEAWLAGDGLSTTGLPTAYGSLTFAARLGGATRAGATTPGGATRTDGQTLTIDLSPGLRAGTPIDVRWPGRGRPREVLVDGQAVSDAGPDGIRVGGPFGRLVARW